MLPVAMLLFALFAGRAAAQDPTPSSMVQTTTFQVGGNCKMCKKRIEDAAQGKGVVKAEWDVDTKIMTLAYDSDITTAMTVQKRVAKAGHDTTFVNAKKKAYDGLPNCCQYERLHYPDERPERQSHDGHNHVH
jgi:hypothetical protein